MRPTLIGLARRAARPARLTALAAGVALAAGLATPALAAPAGPPRGGAGGVRCHAYTLRVGLAAGQPRTSSLWGELCATRRELTGRATIQLLVPGATYNHRYWDFGTVDGVRYSYARDVAAAGIPTFDFDRIGTGRSSHPLSTQLTNVVDAYTIHQVVQVLRRGLPGGGPAFGRVVETGHSMGSALAWQEAATYHDVAGVIVTGTTHYPSDLVSEVSEWFHPAVDDPAFAHSGLDPGYITTIPGVRAQLFYAADDSDPAVIAADEASKEVVSTTDLTGVLGEAASGITAQITVPVLIIIGAKDALNCGPVSPTANLNCGSAAAILAAESPFYSARADLHACSVPGSGHDISLALNHRVQERDTIAWTRAFIGTPGRARAGHRPGPLPGNCT
jgi:pimeloyl-ACP methyl ester carboxylesterase